MIMSPVNENPTAEHSRVVLSAKSQALWEGQYSPDSRWLLFEVVRKWTDGASLGVTSSDGPPDRPWTRIPLRQKWPDKPRWSADGKTLYFLAPEASFIHLWGLAFDPVRG